MAVFKSAKIFGSAFDGSAQEKVGEAVSGAATFYSLKCRMSHSDGRQSVHLGWTGTPTGTFTLWYTNLERPDEATDTDWDQDTTWVVTNPAGAAGDDFVPTGNLVGKWWRVKYANTAGSGNLWGHAVVAE